MWLAQGTGFDFDNPTILARSANGSDNAMPLSFENFSAKRQNQSASEDHIGWRS